MTTAEQLWCRCGKFLKTTARPDSFCPQCEAAPADHLTKQQMTDGAGITYRQLDYWTRRRGYLRPDNPGPGSGFLRTFPPEELRVATLMATLTRAGLSPEAAHLFARQGWLELDGGVRLVMQ